MQMRSCLVLLAVALQAAGQEGWKADPKLLAGLEEKKTAWIYREEKVPPYTLPDLLLCEDGSKVATSDQWEKKRRPETLELFREHVYGRQPPKPAKVTFEVLETDARAMDGRATMRRVKISSLD